MLSHQDGHHGAVALLLKAALIQVSDYRLMGASCFLYHFVSSKTKSYLNLFDMIETTKHVIKHT
jgi:hypothetical protein